jgi:hypothetical protein
MSDEAGWRITVYVNGRARRLFLGLRVRHAIGHPQARLVELGEAAVEDERGNRIELDGALYDGEQLCVRRRRD